MNFGHYCCLKKEDVILLSSKSTLWCNFSSSVKKFIKNLEKFIPLQRVGKPEDISNTCMYLLSDQANYITGTEIIVDGGITSKP